MLRSTTNWESSGSLVSATSTYHSSSKTLLVAGLDGPSDIRNHKHQTAHLQAATLLSSTRGTNTCGTSDTLAVNSCHRDSIEQAAATTLPPGTYVYSPRKPNHHVHSTGATCSCGSSAAIAVPSAIPSGPRVLIRQYQMVSLAKLPNHTSNICRADYLSRWKAIHSCEAPIGGCTWCPARS